MIIQTNVDLKSNLMITIFTYVMVILIDLNTWKRNNLYFICLVLELTVQFFTTLQSIWYSFISKKEVTETPFFIQKNISFGDYCLENDFNE